MLVVVALAATSCSVGSTGPRLGESLAPLAGSELRDESVRIDQEFVSVLTTLSNESDSDLKLHKATLLEPEGLGGVIDIVAIDAVSLSEPGEQPKLSLGDYPSSPLAAEDPVSGDCAVQEVEPLRGFTIEPGEVAALAIRFRGQEVVYEQGGRHFKQRFPMARSGTVTEDGPLLGSKDELSCAPPGSILFGQKDARL